MNDRAREERMLAIEQSHQLMATLSTNADWRGIPTGAIQELISDPERAGELFSRFVSQGLSAVLADELPEYPLRFRRHWHQHDGIIYSRMITNGWLGSDWVAWLHGNGYELFDSVADILCSDKFQPSASGRVREIAIIADGDRLGDKWKMSEINARAEGLGFKPADLETALLFRKSFSTKEMKAMGPVWFIAAHPPLDCEGNQLLVGTNESGRWVGLASPKPNGLWPHYSALIYNRN